MAENLPVPYTEPLPEGFTLKSPYGNNTVSIWEIILHDLFKHLEKKDG